MEHRIAGVENTLYVDGVSTGVNFDGVGDFAVSDDAYQCFVARGTTNKKYDGTNVYNWGIAAPGLAPSVAAIDAISVIVAQFGNPAGAETPTESNTPAAGAGNNLVINEDDGTGAVYVDNWNGDTGYALSLNPSNTSGRATVSKKFNSDQDFYNLGGSIGSHTDLFDMRVWFQEPRNVNKLTIMFGLNTGTDPFVDDYYYFDFNIKNDGTVDMKPEDTNIVAAFDAATNSFLANLTPSEITDVRSPEAAGAIVKRLTSLRGATSTGRRDAQEASPAWGHLSVTRGQFKRVGKTSGRDWSTVRGFKVVYSITVGKTGSSNKVYLDDAIWTGGGSRSLTGDFQVGYRFARRFFDDSGNEVYTELSPMSPISDNISLAQQTLQVTIPNSALNSKDDQVDHTWIYVYGGWLDTFYRFAVTSATVSFGMTIDELTNPQGQNMNTVEERSRMASHGFTLSRQGAQSTVTASSSGTTVTVSHTGHGYTTGQLIYITGATNGFFNGLHTITVTGVDAYTYTASGSFSGAATGTVYAYDIVTGVPARTTTGDIVVSITKSELDALLDNVPYEPGSVGPPNNIIDVAGPWNKRMFALNSEGWLYPSSSKAPSSFSLYHTIDLRQYGTPLWMSKTVGGIYVGCTKDIIRIAGSGDEQNNGLFLDLYAQPLNVANPPVDRAHSVDGNSIFYRSADGPMMFSGSSLQPIPFAGTELLWKNIDRLSQQSLETIKGRFAFEIDNHNLYMLAPEGDFVEASVSSITRTLTTATVTQADHGYSTNDQIVIRGATPTEYNGQKTITVVDVNTYTYTVGDNIDTPATGTITAYKILDPTALWKYQPDFDQWTRYRYPYDLLSLYREPDGSLLAGTCCGRIIEIEYSDSDDDAPIEVSLTTPFYDGGDPLSRKDSADLQWHGTTGGVSGTLSVRKDGDLNPSSSYTLTASQESDVYRTSSIDVGTFLRAGFNVSGTFSEFIMRAMNMTYTTRPQMVMALDSGWIIPPNNADLAWISEVELDCWSNADLQMKFYRDNILFDTADIAVTEGVRDMYRVNCIRGCKGRRLRIYVVTTNSAGSGNTRGFEVYGLRVRFKGSGNLTDLPFGTTDQSSV
jgi:hypothetical protein